MSRFSPNVLSGLTVLSISLAILSVGDVVTLVRGEAMAGTSSSRGVTVSEPQMILPNQDFVVWKSAVRHMSGSSSRFTGEAKISPSFVREIRRHVEGLTDLPELHMGAEGGGVVVPATILTETSDRHVDQYVKNDDEDHRILVEEDNRVAFVLLNDNPDAFFDHHDERVGGGTSIPIVRGSIVSFQGGVLHNTVINSGAVAMLGPFDIRTFSSVGGFSCVNCMVVPECEAEFEEACSPACDNVDMTASGSRDTCSSTTASFDFQGTPLTCPCSCQACFLISGLSSGMGRRGLLGQEDEQLDSASRCFQHPTHERDLFFFNFFWELLFGKPDSTDPVEPECDADARVCYYVGSSALDEGEELYCYIPLGGGGDE